MHSCHQLPGRERLPKAGRGTGPGGQRKKVQNGIHRVTEYEARHREDRYLRSLPAEFGDGLETADIGQEYIDDCQIESGRIQRR